MVEVLCLTIIVTDLQTWADLLMSFNNALLMVKLTSTPYLSSCPAIGSQCKLIIVLLALGSF